MKQLFTPKQVARAISVSESSIKRWCDKGDIATQYTAGGHRRIPIDGLTQFLKNTKHKIVRPEVLGLPATAGQTERVLARAKQQLTDALIQGDNDLARRIVIDLYLANHRISRICDEVFAKVFTEIGDQWACGEAEIFEERRSCQICISILNELSLALPSPDENAPLALGCTPEGDQYTLGTTMAELVLKQAGWKAVSLGNNLPFETMQSALDKYHPQLFWLSVSYIADADQVLTDYQQLHDSTDGDVAFVVGGRALTREFREQMKYSCFCDTMQHLESFAHNYLQAREKNV